MKFLKNQDLYNVNAKFIAVGTKQINNWAANDTPFVIAIDTRADAENNGFDYDKLLKMNVGDVAHDEDYEGILVIRVK